MKFFSHKSFFKDFRFFGCWKIHKYEVHLVIPVDGDDGHGVGGDKHTHTLYSQTTPFSQLRVCILKKTTAGFLPQMSFLFYPEMQQPGRVPCCLRDANKGWSKFQSAFVSDIEWKQKAKEAEFLLNESKSLLATYLNESANESGRKGRKLSFWQSQFFLAGKCPHPPF